ncbi:hypothetical protein [Sebaldella termitidis]|uniref:hypothetical protein n=1 Tax=Sebaldella termitidis TaxID=826 RepID=UPI003EB6BDA9
MKINKNTVTLKAHEIIFLFDLDVDFGNMTNYQFNNYKKALKLLRELKQQLKEHRAANAKEGD